jgi:hypothetical protein
MATGTTMHTGLYSKTHRGGDEELTQAYTEVRRGMRRGDNKGESKKTARYQVFLPDGKLGSLRIAEITSRTVQAILIPRAKLDDAAQRPELKNVGIYFLVGVFDECFYAGFCI